MLDRYSLPAMQAVWEPENKFRKWLDIELAACEANQKLGLIPRKDLQIIKTKARFSVKRIDEIEKETNHDVIAFLTNVAENVGPSSRFVHLGLTSSDIGDTAACLLLKQSAEILEKDLDALLAVLKKQALKYQDTIMIGRTHGIHAEPTTFGLKLLLWHEEMRRNKQRLAQAKKNISVGKLSGAVGTYANIDPFVEKYVCKKLHLTPCAVATQVVQRDRHAEFMTTLAVLGATLEKIAVEIRLLQKTDTAEAAEPFSKGQKGSSAMPHKRNPIICERITGLARVLRGYAVTALENVALWHERDISHSGAERIIFGDGCILLDYMFSLAQKVLAGIEIYPRRMSQNMDACGGIIFSQRVLLALVGKGLTREQAYKLVQRNALRARDEDGSFRDNITSDPEVLQWITKKELLDLFDYQYTIRNVRKIFKRVLK
ncbi:MAG: adenylosuccinate lyase [Candidatus Margulisbacteria bacterium]|jgi:adenylosuccinate lyase|nr:adenylosuccinate lyase [Candidatus Margulisiibacteriota bacterium]